MGKRGPTLCCGTQHLRVMQTAQHGDPAGSTQTEQRGDPAGSTQTAQHGNPGHVLSPAPQPCALILQPHPARVCCGNSGLVTANESKTLTPDKAHVRSHRLPAENGKKASEKLQFEYLHELSMSQMRQSQFYYVFFLLVVLFQPQPSLFWLVLSP